MPFSIDPLALKTEAQKVCVKAEEDINACHLDNTDGIFIIDGLVDQEPIEIF